MNAPSQSFLGRYRLVKVLGQGAMGVVYEAVDTRLGRTVAIKTVLRSHMADEVMAKEYATRFEREAQAAARLSHPNVVAVYDFGEHEDISYIVMEFVRGRELNQAFESGEIFSLPEVVRLMCELLQALDYAHQHGIVHRDVKPANVLIDGAGRVKLTDFGVARVANANSDRTMPGTLVGTPSYMSPEQILGMAVGSRTDIFAAGVVLYQFLTGKRPFTGGGPFGVQRKIVQDDPVPPSQLRADIPPGFDAIIARSLAKKPEHRYDSAGAFAADLEQVAATLPRPSVLLDLDFSDTTTPAPATPSPPPAGGAAAAAAAAAPPATAAAPAHRAGNATSAAAFAPPAAAAPVDPTARTEVTPVPFASQPTPVAGIDSDSRIDNRPPTFAESTPPPFDPEATVIMVRPPVPPGAGRAAAQPPSAPATAPAQAPGPRAALARATAAAPSTPAAVPATAPDASRVAPTSTPIPPPPPAARPPTAPLPERNRPAPPAPQPAATRPAAAPALPPAPRAAPPVAAPSSSKAAEAANPARAMPPDITLLAPSPQPRGAAGASAAGTAKRQDPLPQAAPAPQRDTSPILRALLPVLLGAGIAAIVFGVWLAVTRPTSSAQSTYPSGSTDAASGGGAAQASPGNPSAPSAPSGPVAAGVSVPGPSTTAEPAAQPAVAAPLSPSRATATVPPAPSPATTPAGEMAGRGGGSRPPGPSTRPPAPRPATPGAKPSGSRRDVGPAADQPAPATQPPSRSTEARCSDLLQRMQLGEPLMPEQTQFFQTRCTR